jgi:periplasmic protein TonB
MYSEHSYTPTTSRTVSFGAAFLINGAIIAGLIFSAPQFIRTEKPGGIPVIDISDPPVPPPEPLPKPQPKPSADAPRDVPPNVPKPRIETNTSTNTLTGTDTIYPPLPPLPPEPGGTATGGAVEKPIEPPMPPLIGATQDPRFTGDFQPAYPSSELRAQRDGTVRVRVLIGVDGRVRQVEQVDATSPAFFEATRRQALARWRFKPATRGGIPQESWKVMSVRFELANQ